ncbi:hypothetical protein [uncultured Fusobacterium sp.]|uniref:hypothetical protein n=1 Tax=uncultured Fusobacterium sp. TaxID=159267 RepID=UPI0027DDCC62|nr:hypothetical protein [uncultured Fusobacterium sp.]
MKAFDLQQIVRAGGSIKVSANDFSVFDLQQIAKVLVSNAKLCITDCNKISAFDLQQIAKVRPGQVIFEF